MSDDFWKRLSYLFGLLAIGVIFGLLIFLAHLEVKDLDLWLHIGMGRYLVQHGLRVPAVDILSCSFTGIPWVNHEWLFQVVVYLIHSHWGMDGLVNMQVLLVTLTITMLLFLGYNKERQLVSIFMLLLVVVVFRNRFTIRPDLFSLLFMTAYFWILSHHIDKKWPLFVLFVVQVLWANTHGFFFLGPLLVQIGLSAEWLKRHVRLPYGWNKVGRLTDDEYRRMSRVLLVVVLGCLINPLGLEGALYPLTVFFKVSGDHRIFFDKIIELQKPITLETVFSTTTYPYYKLMILLSFVSLFFNRFKLDIAGLILWLFFLVFSLAAVRNLVFFAFVAYLVFVSNTMALKMREVVPLRITDRKFLYVLAIVVKFLLAVWALQFWMEISMNGYFDFDRYERKSEFEGVSLRSFPNKAADFLVENRVKGNFFNDFNTGAYLVGRTYPDIRIFIDGRTEVYGPEFFKYYVSMWEKDNPEIFAQALERFHITGALMNSVQQPIPPRVLNYLEDSPDWVPVYFDYDGVIYLKKVPQNMAVIEKYAIDFSRWPGKPLDLYRLGTRKVTPYQNINRAHTLVDLGYDAAAVREINMALAVTPVYEEPYKLLGRIYSKRKQYQQAFENYRIAGLFAPNSRDMRYKLAQAYYDLGQYKYSADQYQWIIDKWPAEEKAHFLMSRTLIRMGHYEKAVEFIRHSHALVPEDIKDLLDLGDMLLAEGQYEPARETYTMGLATGKLPAEVHKKLSVVYENLGQPDQAQKHAEAAAEAERSAPPYE